MNNLTTCVQPICHLPRDRYFKKLITLVDFKIHLFFQSFFSDDIRLSMNFFEGSHFQTDNCFLYFLFDFLKPVGDVCLVYSCTCLKQLTVTQRSGCPDNPSRATASIRCVSVGVSVIYTPSGESAATS